MSGSWIGWVILCLPIGYIILAKLLLNKFLKYRNQVATMSNQVQKSGFYIIGDIFLKNNIMDVAVGTTPNEGADNYNSMSKTIYLSPSIYYQPTVASIGIAAHEAGHVLQEKTNSWIMKQRFRVGKLASLSQMLSLVLSIVLIVFIFTSEQGTPISSYIIYFWVFSATYFVDFIFNSFNIWMEKDASKRALNELKSLDSFTPQEMQETTKLLKNAAHTYWGKFWYSLIIFGFILSYTIYLQLLV